MAAENEFGRVVENSTRREPLLRKTLSEQVAEELSLRIIAGIYPSGTRLPAVHQLCEEFGVSRTVIREATKILATRNLIQSRQGIGSIVVDPTMDGIVSMLRVYLQRRHEARWQILEVRRILEIDAAGLAAQRADERNIARLARHIEAMAQAGTDTESWSREDVRFHYEIANATKNEVLMSVNKLIGQFIIETSRNYVLKDPGRIAQAVKEHEEILEGIRRKDPEMAREAMRRHLAQTERDLASGYELRKSYEEESGP